MKSRSLADSFFFAWRGLKFAVVSQRNMKIHLLAAIAVLLAGFLWHITSVEWALVLIVMALVMTAEVINTAIECAVDLVTREMQPLARKAKDAAAGAVLLAAGFSVIIGLIIFLPRLIRLVNSWL